MIPVCKNTGRHKVQSHTFFKKFTPKRVYAHTHPRIHAPRTLTETHVKETYLTAATDGGELVRRHGHRRELHAFLFLSLIAEPHAHNVLLEVQFLGDLSYLLAGRARLDGEVRLEGALLRRRYRRPLALFVVDAAEDVDGHLVVASLFLGLLKPRVQHGFESDHVVVAEGERLEAADRALTEGADAWQLEVAKSRANVRLRDAQLNPTLLKVFGERLELARVAVHLLRLRRRGLLLWRWRLVLVLLMLVLLLLLLLLLRLLLRLHGVVDAVVGWHAARVAVDGVGGVQGREHLRGVRAQPAVLSRDRGQGRHRHAGDLLQHRFDRRRVRVQLHLVGRSGGRLRRPTQRLTVHR